MFKKALGIDVSKDKFDVSIVNENGDLIRHDSLLMNSNGFDELSKLIENEKELLIAFESTGCYHTCLLDFLLKRYENVYLVSPVLIKRFIESKDQRKTKTDKKDATNIANFIQINYMHLHKAEKNSLYEALQLARHRETFSDDISVAKTMFKQILGELFPEIIKNTNEIYTNYIYKILLKYPSADKIKSIGIKTFEKHFYKIISGVGARVTVDPKFIYKLANESIGIKSFGKEMIIKSVIEKIMYLEKELKNLTNECIKIIESEANKDLKILKSIKGIDNVIALHILTEIGSIKRFKNYRKLIAFAGTDPAYYQSGQMEKNGKISKRGSSSLRRIIFLAGDSVRRYNEKFGDYYNKKRNEGMCYKKAIIATSNKLLKVIFCLLSKGICYDPTI